MKIVEPDSIKSPEVLDWRANPEEVLEAVDRVLLRHNLWIELEETSGDDYVFTVSGVEDVG